MDAATIEETNRIRASLGMKPLPMPGAQAFQSDSSSDSEEEAPSTLESRQAQAYDNYKKIRDAEDAKKKREQKAAAVKKARDSAQRFASLEGKGLAEAGGAGDVSTKSWLKNQKKRQKEIEKARKLDEERAAAEADAVAAVQYTSKDLAGVKVAHDVSAFLDGDEQILTLKDTTIEENEEEGDELENADLRDQEKLTERLELKKKKPAYNVHDNDDGDERKILAQYDEEIYGKKTKKFTLDTEGAIADLVDSLDGPPERTKNLQNISLDVLADAPSSDYLDISQIKVKKPKKKNKSTRQKAVDETDIFPTETAPADDLMDVDSTVPSFKKKRKAEDDDFVDDEDLQASLAIQRQNALKKRKRTRPEDIARQLKEADAQEPTETQDAGLVINSISEFVATVRTSEEDEEKKLRKAKTPVEEPVTAMGGDSEDEDHPMNGETDIAEEDAQREETPEDELAAIGVDEEKTVGQGMGATLQLLRERGLVKPSHGDQLNADFRRREEFLAKKRQMEAEGEEYARQQRERDRTSGRLDRMSGRDRQEIARQQNERRDLQQSRHMAQLFQAEYKPNVELKYTDEYGRSLDQKEAFKHLSHQFHGKGSGKGKTDKRLKKIEDEKRREAQSMLDASQNVGMSSATAQQLKKRKEAGVRLA